jgi:hypothetical protein
MYRTQPALLPLGSTLLPKKHRGTTAPLLTRAPTLKWRWCICHLTYFLKLLLDYEAQVQKMARTPADLTGSRSGDLHFMLGTSNKADRCFRDVFVPWMVMVWGDVYSVQVTHKGHVTVDSSFNWVYRDHTNSDVTNPVFLLFDSLIF